MALDSKRRHEPSYSSSSSSSSSPRKARRGTKPPLAPPPSSSSSSSSSSTASSSSSAAAHAQLSRIALSHRTDFEKRVWTALCQIPEGCVTTYGLLSKYLGSSPRAVGNALRRNPFAPEVPCHRVVATGMALGGFKGKWPRDGVGVTLEEKRSLLEGEGVEFDEGGRVVSLPWCGWC